MSEGPNEVVLEELTKTYGSVNVVEQVSLRIGKGELVSLLGPSGCGKTTTLRMIAGFVEPSAGRILIRGIDMTHRLPHRRDIGMVFQNYALFPHLTVAENIAFGLKRRGVGKAECARQVSRMIGLLRLDGLQDRLPRALSGGQQQRVAVGRALVINPTVILLDEPFSNLDAKLRESTRMEMRKLQQDLSLTAVFVTHDQEEAMSMSDRVAVMNQGRIVQLDRPHEIYERPRSRFVADFIGSANIFDCRATSVTADRLLAESESGLRFLAPRYPSASAGDPITVVLRPESIALATPTGDEVGANQARGRVETISYHGARAHIVVRLAAGAPLMVEVDGRTPRVFPPGTAVALCWPAEALVAFPKGP